MNIILKITSLLFAIALLASCQHNDGIGMPRYVSVEQEYRWALQPSLDPSPLIKIDEKGNVLFTVSKSQLPSKQYYALTDFGIREFEHWPPNYNEWRTTRGVRSIWGAVMPVKSSPFDLKPNFRPENFIVYSVLPPEMISDKVGDLKFDPNLTYVLYMRIRRFDMCTSTPEKSSLIKDGKGVTDPLPCNATGGIRFTAAFSLSRDADGKASITPKIALDGF